MMTAQLTQAARQFRRLVCLGLAHLLLAAAPGGGGVVISPDGRTFTYRGEARLLVGESATQSVLQNANLDLLVWLDELERRGVRAALVWLFMPARQVPSQGQFDPRYGYAIPVLMPWPRDRAEPARDGGPQYDLTRFDPAFWERVRELCAETQRRGIVLAISLLDGWSKDFTYHPLNQANGGIWPDQKDGRDAIARLSDPGRDVVEESWDPDWPPAKRNQWVWERLTAKALEATAPYDNVLYELYNEGSPGAEWAQHFRRFIAARSDKPLGHDRDPAFDFITHHVALDRPAAVLQIGERFAAPPAPARPLVITETMPAYQRGAKLEAIRQVIYGALLSGQHVFVQNDGVFRFDPRAPAGDRGGAVRDLIAQADRFIHRSGAAPGALRPAPESVGAGAVLVLADAELPRLAYSWSGAEFTLDLGPERGWELRWLDVRSGSWRDPEIVRAAGPYRFVKPDARDWALALRPLP